jgi:UDP-GlcNAc:undecaprenyl-phosphate GlcNAc-1-phosphate transferase
MVDHPKPGRFHSDPTPYLGGLAVAAGLIGVGVVASGAEGQLLTILLCGAVLGAMGLLDDWRSVHPLVRVVVESGCGVALWVAGIRAGFFGVPALDLLLTVAFIVLITNAVNLIDNMDGLSSGVVAISAFTFFAIAASRGDYLVASFALVVAGASLGFLRHNFPPASVFLGDTGSLMLGFFLASLALQLDLEGPGGPARALVVLLILGVPLFDTLLVVTARFQGGRKVYLGATDHSSHRMSSHGYSPRKIAVVTYAAQTALCGIALALTNASLPVIVVSLGALTVIATLLLLVMLRMPHPERESAGELLMLPEPDRRPSFLEGSRLRSN